MNALVTLVLLCLPLLAAPFTFPPTTTKGVVLTRLYNDALIVSSDTVLTKSVQNASPSATSADALVVYLNSGCSEAEVSAVSAAAMQCKPKRALVLHSSRVSPKAVLEALGPHCSDTSTTSLLGDPVGFFSAEAIECDASSPPLFQEDGSPSVGLMNHDLIYSSTPSTNLDHFLPNIIQHISSWITDPSSATGPYLSSLPSNRPVSSLSALFTPNNVLRYPEAELAYTFPSPILKAEVKKLALYMVTKWAPVTLARNYDVGGVRTGERPVNVDYTSDDEAGTCDVMVNYQTLEDFQVVPAGKLVFKVSQWGVEVERVKEDKGKRFKGESVVVEGFWDGVEQAGKGGVFRKVEAAKVPAPVGAGQQAA
eukprot:CAMPEP_0182456284 /NCGR_PEP_ID=MMETSP1319-20130603/2165_1 /TAXON_ID=172717 /ORGANISM="Bolidomonas pacifica, Strain RCC208" /LENGTH=366 /DNA_ID=CAMNT_0024654495 /DNA_START=92 /DNA_END=1188 /DNA_ORIENTATION=+